MATQAKALNLVDFLEQKRRTAKYSSEVLSQLLTFGALMTTEVQQRSAQIDAKLGSYLGYCVSLVGLLGIGSALSGHEQGGYRLFFQVGLLLAVAFATGAIIVICYAIKGRETPVPSEVAWFGVEQMKDVEGLRMLHLTALHKSHTLQQTQNQEKGELLTVAEGMMAIAGIVAGCVLISRLLILGVWTSGS